MRSEDCHVRGGVHTPQPLRIPTGQALCAAHIETGTNLTPLFFMFFRRKFFRLGILSTIKHHYGLFSLYEKYSYFSNITSKSTAIMKIPKYICNTPSIIMIRKLQILKKQFPPKKLCVHSNFFCCALHVLIFFTVVNICHITQRTVSLESYLI